MTNQNTNASLWQLPLLIALSGIWLTWWWLLFLLASIGQFSTTFVAGSLVVAIGSTIAINRHLAQTKTSSTRRVTAKKTRILTFASLVGALAFLAIALSPLLVSPTVFSGRDQGSYSLAAIQLARTHRIAFDSPSAQTFFDIAGPGKALNFPGFAYTSTGSLVPQFPLGSIVWYAGFVSLFGLAGFFIANVITATLSIFLFFTLLRIFLPLRFSLFGASLFAVSFPLVWFGRFTLSENLALPLFLLLAIQTLRLLVQPSRITLLLAIMSALALAITRIEGWIILVMFGIALALAPGSRQWCVKQFSRSTAILTFTIIILVGLRDGVLNLAFFRSLASTLWHKWIEPVGSISGSSATQLFSLWQTLWLYTLAPIFLIGLFTAVLLTKKRHWLALVPFFLALPTLVYLFNANISADHPWMLRRFAFTLWPVFLFLTFVGIHTLNAFLHTHQPKRLFSRIFLPLLLTSLTLSIPLVTLRFLPVIENPFLLHDTATLAARFSDRDLILVDRLASGDPFAMIAGPLQSILGVQAVYFFNPADLKRLDTSRFDHIYLITDPYATGISLDAFDSQLTFIDTITLRTETLDTTTDDPTRVPALHSQSITDLLFEYHPQSTR
jgi:hypothetical protein